MIHVTNHAILRWQERIDASATQEQAKAIILGASRAIETAAKFGCDTVRMGCGAKLVLQGNIVVTVLARSSINMSRRAGGVR